MADADNDRSAERPHYFPAQPGTGAVLVDFCYVDPVDPVPEPMTADDLIQEHVPLIGWRYVDERAATRSRFSASPKGRTPSMP